MKEVRRGPAHLYGERVSRRLRRGRERQFRLDSSLRGVLPLHHRSGAADRHIPASTNFGAPWNPDRPSGSARTEARAEPTSALEPWNLRRAWGLAAHKMDLGVAMRYFQRQSDCLTEITSNE